MTTLPLSPKQQTPGSRGSPHSLHHPWRGSIRVFQTRKLKYRVVGWEDIEVPAGKFKALKIEAEGSWTGEIAPRTTASIANQAGAQGTTAVAQTVNVREETVTGRLYQAYWYAPDVKREVKSVEENYDTNGVRSARFTNELESYKVAR